MVCWYSHLVRQMEGWTASQSMGWSVSHIMREWDTMLRERDKKCFFHVLSQLPYDTQDMVIMHSCLCYLQFINMHCAIQNLMNALYSYMYYKFASVAVEACIVHGWMGMASDIKSDNESNNYASFGWENYYPDCLSQLAQVTNETWNVQKRILEFCMWVVITIDDLMHLLVYNHTYM